jgi:hypothetical protein
MLWRTARKPRLGALVVRTAVLPLSTLSLTAQTLRSVATHLHRAMTPSDLAVRLKQSTIPLYLRSRRPVFNISSYSASTVSNCIRTLAQLHTLLSCDAGSRSSSCGAAVSPFSFAYLVLDKELDTLDGSGGSLRDGGSDTTHQEVNHEARHPHKLRELAVVHRGEAQG